LVSGCTAAIPNDERRILDCYAAATLSKAMKLQTASIEQDGLPSEDSVIIISIEPFVDEARPDFASQIAEKFPNSSLHIDYFIEQTKDYMNTFHKTVQTGDASKLSAMIVKSQRICTRDTFE
jgi:hypothetical protein